MHPVSCTKNSHDVTDLVHYGMVKSTFNTIKNTFKSIFNKVIVL